jgi:uncharacterized membrane protein YedE/YeeE
MQLLTAFISGLLFGLGLITSQMVNPSKVLNFLDMTGQWDPSLIFVMAGAILVSFFAFKKAKHMQTSLIGENVSLPTQTKLDAQLIGGAIIFGIGWGLAGYCPGPVLVSLTYGYTQSFVFVLAMLLGMLVYEFSFGKKAKK